LTTAIFIITKTRKTTSCVLLKTTMSSLDSIALVWGSAALGLAPLVCFFFQIVYPKSQLLIVAISAAFFYLLSSLASGFCWYILDPVIGLSSGWCAIAPAIFCQFLLRVGFVKMYHKVEQAIEQSIAITEMERQDDGNNDDDNDNESEGNEVAAAKLKLELNDAASGMAAGVGFGGMHAIVFFGSLLASESATTGVLFQPSCPSVPTLVVSALNCSAFFFLDIVWMLFTFFGIRRRMIFPRGGGNLNDLNPRHRQYGAYFGNTRLGGNMSLVIVLLSHFFASGSTTFNLYNYGCNFSLPLLATTVIVVGYLFHAGISQIYKPLPYSNQRLSLPASFSYASHASRVGENEDGMDYVEQMRSEG
jgi:hypothetical protein